MERERGFYRVRKGIIWTIAYWSEGIGWEVFEDSISPLRDLVFDEINETPVNPNPDEQEIEKAFVAGYERRVKEQLEIALQGGKQSSGYNSEKLKQFCEDFKNSKKSKQ